MNATFDVNDFLHPLDLSTRQQLERIPLLQQSVKGYLQTFTDRKIRQFLLATTLRLGPNQLPEIYRLLPPICDAFGIPEPELFLTRGDANAYTVGHSRSAIVLQSGLLEDLAEDEIEAVLAHECGHIMAEHVLYRQMAQMMVRAGESAGAFGGAFVRAATAIGTSQLQSTLFNWYRKSELTADRAAVAYMRRTEPMQRALFHILGVPKWMPGELSYTAFLQQATEFEEINESKWERFLSRGLDAGATHPMPTLRMKEITKWAESDQFAQVLRTTNAARSGDDDRTPCAKCGHSMQPEWRFCQRCGTAVLRENREREGAS